MSSEAKKKILIAEDELDLREAVTVALTEAGYEVIEAIDGEEALKKYHETKPDLVLLDLNMPKKHGLEVLGDIRASEGGTTVQVCILTAQDDIATVSDATVTGGMHTDFLPKASRSLSEIVEHVNEYFAQ